MQEGELQSFIEQQRRAGFTEAQIKDYLLKYGYNINQINQYFNPDTNNATAIFVKEHIEQGYTIPQISEYLRSHGVSETEIHNSIHNAVNQKKNKMTFEEFTKSDYFKFGVPILFSIICIIMFTGLFMSLGEKKLLDVEIDVLNEYARAGEDLKIQVSAINLGGARKFDITANLKLIGTSVEYEEMFAIETRVSKTMVLPLPIKLEPGEYILQATLNYNKDSIAISRITIPINKARVNTQQNETPIERNPPIINNTTEPETNQTTPASNNSSNNINNSQENNNNNNNNSETPTIPGLGTIEKDRIYKDTAIQNSDSSDCYFIQNTTIKDECYYKVSEISLNETDCNNIINTVQKESCLVELVSKGAIDTCEGVKELKYRRTCENILANQKTFTQPELE